MFEFRGFCKKKVVFETDNEYSSIVMFVVICMHVYLKYLDECILGVYVLGICIYVCLCVCTYKYMQFKIIYTLQYRSLTLNLKYTAL